MCDCGRFIVSIGSPCLERFGKSEKIFQKKSAIVLLVPPKNKKAEGLPLLDVSLGLWLCLSKTTSIIPQDAPFELKVMFCTQSRFTYHFILYWVRERYERPYYILPKEGCPSGPHTFFINELAELQRFVSNITCVNIS